MEHRSILRPLIAIASLVVIVAGLKASAELLGPVLLSLFIVLVTAPLVEWLRSRKVPVWLARVLVVLGVVAIGLILIAFLAASIVQLSAALPIYRTLLDTQIRELIQWLQTQGIQATDLLKLDLANPTRILQFMLTFLRGLLDTLGNVTVTLFIFIYMLVGAPSFSRKLVRGLGVANPMIDRVNACSNSISVYLLIKSWLGALTALGHIFLLWILGVDFAVLWGIISFLFNFIPNIGFIISLIPPVLMALLKFGFVKAMIVAVGYILVNNFFDVVIAPRYLGKGLNLSTLIIFLAVIFWTWILGPIGAFLALPLTVMLKKLVLEHYADCHLLAELIGAEEEEPSQPESQSSVDPLQ